MNIPYDKMDLLLSLLSIKEEYLTEDLENEMSNIGKNVSNKVELNKEVAENNGISVETLINSPNYNVLIEEYKNKLIYDTVAVMKKAGLEDKQAWAIIAQGLGLLDM